MYVIVDTAFWTGKRWTDGRPAEQPSDGVVCDSNGVAGSAVRVARSWSGAVSKAAAAPVSQSGAHRMQTNAHAHWGARARGRSPPSIRRGPGGQYRVSRRRDRRPSLGLELYLPQFVFLLRVFFPDHRSLCLSNCPLSPSLFKYLILKIQILVCRSGHRFQLSLDVLRSVYRAAVSFRLRPRTVSAGTVDDT